MLFWPRGEFQTARKRWHDVIDAYLDQILDARHRQGHYFRWPPERNQPCWCGATVKYKKCCGKIA
ncbi:MAG: hypothetical protein QOG10_4708 [Kribbellaceae bacterium]|nr:hypothetical protein [Kribbellaceae bacterium]